MELRKSQHNYFDDVANYLIALISLTLTAELYIRGAAGKYSPNHTVQLDAKQAGKRLRFYPYTLLDDIFQLKWPTTLSFEPIFGNSRFCFLKKDLIKNKNKMIKFD